MLPVLALLVVSTSAVFPGGEVKHELEPCHGKCLNPLYESTGDCPSGFCGAGACCQRGSVKPPCDGVSMGCDGFKCCVRPVSFLALASSGGEHAAAAVPPPAMPPLPPLSECAIARVQYEIGRMRRDEYGDKIFEVILHVEPWRADSIIKLVYHQTDVEGGNERPIE